MLVPSIVQESKERYFYFGLLRSERDDTAKLPFDTVPSKKLHLYSQSTLSSGDFYLKMSTITGDDC